MRPSVRVDMLSFTAKAALICDSNTTIAGQIVTDVGFSSFKTSDSVHHRILLMSPVIRKCCS